MPTRIATLSQPSQAELLQRYPVVRGETLCFAAPLTAEDMMVQSCPEASPVKWHLAHTSWFFETFVLTPYVAGYSAFHPDFKWLFNSYYNSLGEMPEKKLRASFSRPSLEAILAYRLHVDDAMNALLGGNLGEHGDEIARRVALGLEHEQQHLELIATDIKHAFFTNPLHPAYREGSEKLTGGSAPKLSFTSFDGGLTQIGITPEKSNPPVFAFDNETPEHTVYLHPYVLANRLVTAGEYLAFMNDNGYTRPELWLSEGWSMMRAEGWEAPLYWRRDPAAPSGWSVFMLQGFRSLDTLLDMPACHLSFFEADAFARWSGCRLPTEFEWEHAAKSLETLIGAGASGPELVSVQTMPNQTAQVGTKANLLERGNLHTVAAEPVSSLQQMFGDVWEWTSSGYTGYPGYRPLPGALGEYNGKFMSSQVILRGGSCVTPATHIRATYRNFFPPGTRWQFSGLRLAQDFPAASAS